MVATYAAMYRKHMWIVSEIKNETKHVILALYS